MNPNGPEKDPAARSAKKEATPVQYRAKTSTDLLSTLSSTNFTATAVAPTPTPVSMLSPVSSQPIKATQPIVTKSNRDRAAAVIRINPNTPKDPRPSRGGSLRSRAPPSDVVGSPEKHNMQQMERRPSPSTASMEDYMSGRVARRTPPGSPGRSPRTSRVSISKAYSSEQLQQCTPSLTGTLSTLLRQIDDMSGELEAICHIGDNITTMVHETQLDGRLPGEAKGINFNFVPAGVNAKPVPRKGSSAVSESQAKEIRPPRITSSRSAFFPLPDGHC